MAERLDYVRSNAPELVLAFRDCGAIDLNLSVADACRPPAVRNTMSVSQRWLTVGSDDWARSPRRKAEIACVILLFCASRSWTRRSVKMQQLDAGLLRLDVVSEGETTVPLWPRGK